ncbi:hypothetical protein YC2023_042958 [Brassica napus]
MTRVISRMILKVSKESASPIGVNHNSLFTHRRKGYSSSPVFVRSHPLNFFFINRTAPNTLLKIKEEEEQRQEEDEESEVKKTKHESDAEFKEVSSYGDMKRLKESKIMNMASNWKRIFLQDSSNPHTKNDMIFIQERCRLLGSEKRNQRLKYEYQKIL